MEHKIERSSDLRTFQRWLYFSIALLYIAMTLQLFRDMPISRWEDTAFFEATAQLELSDPAFWSESATLPLLYKLCDNDADCITQTHLRLAMVAWILLASAVALYLEHGILKMVGFGIVLGLGISAPVVLWHKVLLSESITNSLFILIIATWLLTIKMPPFGESQIVVWVVHMILAGAWIFARDLNVYIALIGMMVLGSVVIARWKQQKDTRYMLAGICAGVLVLCCVQLGLTQQPLIPSFEDSATNQTATLTYITLPQQETLLAPLERADTLLNSDPTSYAKAEEPLPRYLDYAHSTLYSPSGLWLIGLLLVTGGLLGKSFIQNQMTGLGMVPLLLLSLAYPMGFVVWRLGGDDLTRAASDLSLQVRVSGWLLLLFMVDRLPVVGLKPAVVRAIQPHWIITLVPAAVLMWILAI